MTESSPMSWILWPFEALWGFVTWILELTGRLIAIVLGVVLMIAGLIVSITLVGAVIGIPMVFIGVLLILRGLF